MVEISVTDNGTEVATATVAVTAAMLPAENDAVKVDLDITIPPPKSLTVEVDSLELPADGTSTSTVTVTVQDGGEGVTGDTITLSVDNGTVDATATEVGNGVYTATYTAPAVLPPIIPIAQINVSSATTGLTGNAVILLTPVPTIVTVSVDPTTFIADTAGTGAVTVTVDRAGPCERRNRHA